MKFKIVKKSLAKITIFLLLIILLLIINTPNITESLPEGSKLKLEDPKVINSFWSRKITVYSDEDKHYYNIPVSISISENLANVMLYRYLSSDLKMDVTDKPEYNFQVVDSDSNGLTDIVKWVVPELSEVSFSVEGIITEGKNSGIQITQEQVVVTFDRRLDCQRCGQHKTPPLTDVNMTITATVSNPVTNGVLIDYYPVDWSVTDANDGSVSSFNSSYNRIEWYVGNVVDTISKWYVVRSPSLTSPPTKYYFFSEFVNQTSEPWMIIVSDPTSTITYNFLTVSSDLTNLRWAQNVTAATATQSDSHATVAGVNCWTTATTYKGMFTVPNFTWSGVGYVLVNGTWTVSAKYREAVGGGGATAACQFYAIISKINSTGQYVILVMNNSGGTDVCVKNTNTAASNTTSIPYSDLTKLTSPADRLNITICYFATSAGTSSTVTHFMNSTADSYVIIPNQTVLDTTSPTWSQAQDNSSYKIYRGQVVNISAVWQDDFGLSQAWLSTNETGSWKNYTDGTYGSPRSLSNLGPTTVNFTWQNQTGIPRVIGWIIYTNDTSNNQNGTNSSGIVINFTMWGWSNITWISPNGGSANVGDTLKLVCFVNDTNTTGSGPISGYDVKFYNLTASSSSLLGTNYTNSTGHAILYWNTSGLTAGTYYPKCNITSNSTLFYNASEYYQANTTVSLSNIVEITTSQALSKGIIFGDITPNTKGNPARNNTSGPSSGTEYNLTVGSSSTNNLDFYVKLNETFETGIYINESSSSTSASSIFSTNTTVDASWSILGNTTSNCTNIVVGGNCWMRLYFDVSNVPSGYKQRNYSICGVVTGSNPSICG